MKGSNMREIRLKDIREVRDSSEGEMIKRLIRDFMRSKPGYSSERKRPRNPEESSALASFSRK
jgi:hypothetical protein